MKQPERFLIPALLPAFSLQVFYITMWLNASLQSE